jgi:hypothetical protein
VQVDQVSQGVARDQLHDDEPGVAVGAGVEHAHDVGVRQAGGCLGLAAEALEEGGVVGVLGEQDLDGDPAGEQPVVAFVDLGHPAGAQQPANLVTPRQHAGTHCLPVKPIHRADPGDLRPAEAGLHGLPRSQARHRAGRGMAIAWGRR